MIKQITYFIGNKLKCLVEKIVIDPTLYNLKQEWTWLSCIFNKLINFFLPEPIKKLRKSEGIETNQCV